VPTAAETDFRNANAIVWGGTLDSQRSFGTLPHLLALRPLWVSVVSVGCAIIGRKRAPVDNVNDRIEPHLPQTWTRRPIRPRSLRPAVRATANPLYAKVFPPPPRFMEHWGNRARDRPRAPTAACWSTRCAAWPRFAPTPKTLARGRRRVLRPAFKPVALPQCSQHDVRPSCPIVSWASLQERDALEFGSLAARRTLRWARCSSRTPMHRGACARTRAEAHARLDRFRPMPSDCGGGVKRRQTAKRGACTRREV